MILDSSVQVSQVSLDTTCGAREMNHSAQAKTIGTSAGQKLEENHGNLSLVHLCAASVVWWPPAQHLSASLFFGSIPMRRKGQPLD